MSVYTTVDSEQLDHFLERYVLGKSRTLRPIVAGITNTNYFLDTDAGEFILTLYEHHSDDELDYILGLQQHLAAQSVYCASPMLDRRGGFYSSLNQRPAAIIHRVDGAVVSSPGANHCAAIGAELARFHRAGLGFDVKRPNPRGLDWMMAACDMLDQQLEAEDRQLVEACLLDYRNSSFEGLPEGAIHADLFHDNALFNDEGLSGIIDFDYACNDLFAFDIAVLLNDWCIDADGELNPSLLDATLEAYCEFRPMSEAELDCMSLMLRFAALRFWLSRLYDKTFPLSGELTTIKSPDAFRHQLVLRSDAGDSLASLFVRHRAG